MKAFSFRLETFLHLKEMRKKRLLVQYADSLREREKIEDRLEAKKFTLDQIRNEVSERRSFGFSGSEQATYQTSIDLVESEILDLHSEFENAKKIEESKKAVYIKADSEHQSLVKLKGKRKHQHLYAEAKKEENELTDLINSRFIFNKSLTEKS